MLQQYEKKMFVQHTFECMYKCLVISACVLLLVLKCFIGFFSVLALDDSVEANISQKKT